MPVGRRSTLFPPMLSRRTAQVERDPARALQKGVKMKHTIAVPVIVLMILAVGCAKKQQVKVTFLSDPPGGWLYKENGDPWGPCPKALWYDLDKTAIERGYLEAKEMVVRWPDGPEKSSDGLIRITVDGTDRHVVFLQQNEEPKAEYVESSK